MAYYSTPNVSETSDLLGVFQFVNDKATDGAFFPIILLSIWFIAFIGSIAEGRPAGRAFVFSSFISVILGVLLVILNFMNINYIYFLILLVAFGIFWLKLQKARND